MTNPRSRPKGYFLTILQENDRYFTGDEKGLLPSSRRYLNLGSTVTEIREKIKTVKLREGEHLWMGYQGTNTMPSVKGAWVQIYGKRIQYRNGKGNSYDKGFNWKGVNFESLFPFVSEGHRYFVDWEKCEYNFTRDVIARRNLTVQQKKYLCSLCGCHGKYHEDCRDIETPRGRTEFATCGFSMCYDWEEDVKKTFPFGVVCYKWGVKKKVVEYVKNNLW